MAKRRKRQFDVQVGDPKHYGAEYDDLQRFTSYYWQIEFTRQARPRRVMEIGIGNRAVSDYLERQLGYRVTTCDFDKRLKPDVVADIREIPVPDDSQDVVIACEILEHIPYADVGKALRELRRVAKKRVVISVPYSSFTVEIIAAVSMTFHGGKTVRLPLRFPQFLAGDVSKKNDQHRWELGRRGYSRRKFRKLIRDAGFSRISKEFHPHLHPYHRFFVLET